MGRADQTDIAETCVAEAAQLDAERADDACPMHEAFCALALDRIAAEPRGML